MDISNFENQERLAREGESEQKTQAIRSIREGSFEQVSPVISTLSWTELEVRFRALQPKTTDRRVSTDFIETKWNSGKVTQEWFFGGNAAWRAEFEALASIATGKLGRPQNEGTTDYWLNCIREWMQQKGLDRDKGVALLSTGEGIEAGLTGKTQGFSTDRIAELSGMLCLEMLGRGTPESLRPGNADESPKSITVPKKVNNKKPGRPQTRNRGFQALAGGLWCEELNGSKRITSDGLKTIASKLDASDYKKPSDHLEKRAAEALRIHNRNNGNAPAKTILCWAHLVERGDKHQIRAMRDVLSRCGSITRK